MNNQEKQLNAYLRQVQASEQSIHFDVERFNLLVGAIIKVPDLLGYVYDYRLGDVVHHFGFETVLGHGSETIINAQFITKDLIHPDDRPAVQYLSLMATKYLLEYSKPLPDPFETLFTICYRIRKVDGEYIWAIRRSSSFQNDENGVPISTIGFLQPIDFLSNPKRVRAKVIGPEHLVKDFETFIEEAQLLQKNDLLSASETRVLHYLAMGMPSSEIAEKLFLSKHTVNNHRKNMLRKTGLKNSAELVRFGLENGLL